MGSSLTSLCEDLLPDINPLLLLIRQRTMGIAERVRQGFAQTSVQDFQSQHGLPVAHGEADAIRINGNDSRVHLSTVLALSSAYWNGWIVSYLELGITTQ